jgi:hypothetical protein
MPLISAHRARRDAIVRYPSLAAPRGGAAGRRGPRDQTLSKAAYTLKLPATIKAATARLAKDGVSLNQWIATSVAHKIGAVETQPISSDTVPERPTGRLEDVPDGCPRCPARAENVGVECNAHRSALIKLAVAPSADIRSWLLFENHEALVLMRERNFEIVRYRQITVFGLSSPICCIITYY